MILHKYINCLEVWTEISVHLMVVSDCLHFKRDAVTGNLLLSHLHIVLYKESLGSSNSKQLYVGFSTKISVLS